MDIWKIAAFTENGVGGNPAGVVLCEALPDNKAMQEIAAEVGYSETAFAALDGDHWKTRYFSPESEVPFCGHATIALGSVLAQQKGEGRYRLSLSNGDIELDARLVEGAGYVALRSLPTSNAPVSSSLVDEALALFGYPHDALDERLPPIRMNAGNDHLFIALKSRELLRAMYYDLDEGRSFMLRHGFVTVAFVWRESDKLFHARNAFASGGVIEDPATGAAAAALAGMLRDQGFLTSGQLTILQGFDMGRPSRILVRYAEPAGSPVWVTGSSTEIV
ncbi:PhzF family phenazine biosynthesis protein [Castellaniella sp. UC4442_H9]